MGKVVMSLLALYFFICALDLLSNAGKLLTGHHASQVFSPIRGTLHNPIVGLMLGILVTVLLQSSSTTTSIIVGLVSAGIIEQVK